MRPLKNHLNMKEELIALYLTESKKAPDGGGAYKDPFNWELVRYRPTLLTRESFRIFQQLAEVMEMDLVEFRVDIWEFEQDKRRLTVVQA